MNNLSEPPNDFFEKVIINNFIKHKMNKEKQDKLMPLIIQTKLAAINIVSDQEKRKIGDEINDLLKEYSNSL